MTVPLSHWPTPLDRAPRLAAALGLRPDDLVVKRDDLTDLGGGNKVRKLEHLAAEALRDGATVLVTSGGVQSNHARMTAAAAARLGLRAVLVLGGTPGAGRQAAGKPPHSSSPLLRPRAPATRPPFVWPAAPLRGSVEALCPLK